MHDPPDPGVPPAYRSPPDGQRRLSLARLSPAPARPLRRLGTRRPPGFSLVHPLPEGTPMPARTTRRTLLTSGAGLAGLALLAACGTADAAAGGSGRLAPVANTPPKGGHADHIPALPKTTAGNGLPFSL